MGKTDTGFWRKPILDSGENRYSIPDGNRYWILYSNPKIPDSKDSKYYSIEIPASSIQYQSIQYPASEHPVSSIQHQSIQYPVSSIQYQSIQHPSTIKTRYAFPQLCVENY